MSEIALPESLARACNSDFDATIYLQAERVREILIEKRTYFINENYKYLKISVKTCKISKFLKSIHPWQGRATRTLMQRYIYKRSASGKLS